MNVKSVPLVVNPKDRPLRIGEYYWTKWRTVVKIIDITRKGSQSKLTFLAHELDTQTGDIRILNDLEPKDLRLMPESSMLSVVLHSRYKLADLTEEEEFKALRKSIISRLTEDKGRIERAIRNVKSF
ncbi:MAG: hypothetical protein A3B89_00240 [Candidatus Buchananbacteria bacterium RIFCSPHIGHO2_02_FULL_40_13]|nr:MAG: hypothetical protein A2820_03120 [Candidatus Buchananbacteria bacterium RIFCSPHIGHO2_01_FULL_40_35]OGY49506.1 MAG: hypothetical protein A3B89_00240 [Candidatus Buchananbacteria bacterium RIFCSPHIGHO2_02_FULL_40_13]